LRHEAVSDAVTRSVDHLEKLAQEFNILTRDVLRYGNPSTICNHIVAGRISPWVLWQSVAGREFLETKLTEEQTQWIYEYINPEQWQLKFTRNPEEVVQAKQQLEKMGI
jgi:deoxyribodipyrimidine photolyase